MCRNLIFPDHEEITTIGDLATKVGISWDTMLNIAACDGDIVGLFPENCLCYHPDLEQFGYTIDKHTDDPFDDFVMAIDKPEPEVIQT